MAFCDGNVDVPSGVELCGVVSKEQLHRLQASCRFSVIPSDFPEMFCLAANGFSPFPAATSRNSSSVRPRSLRGEAPDLLSGAFVIVFGRNNQLKAKAMRSTAFAAGILW